MSVRCVPTPVYGRSCEAVPGPAFTPGRRGRGLRLSSTLSAAFTRLLTRSTVNRADKNDGHGAPISPGVNAGITPVLT